MNRIQVLWFGRPASDGILREHTYRNLAVKTMSGSPTDSELAQSCSAVFNFDSRQPGQSIGLLNSLASRCIDHGLLVMASGTSEEVRLLQAHSGTWPAVVIRDSVANQDHDLAERSARHDPGLPFNANLGFRGCTCEAAHEFLIRRAFSDFHAVSIHPLLGGRSDASVYLIHGEFKGSAVGDYPLPYFAKIDTASRIDLEQYKYRTYAKNFIPFGHRPNMDPMRCLFASKLGILVGDFVDNAVPLSRVVRPTGARQVIHSLFDDALAGWRHQAYTGKEPSNPIAFLKDVFKPARVHDVYLATAKGFGGVTEPDELSDMIANSNHIFRCGPVHGDLHADNIFVRNGEAILIDFFKTDIGPIAADLACLETAICFSLEADEALKEPTVPCTNFADSPRFKDWKAHIDELFLAAPPRFGSVPPTPNLPCSHPWMWSVCRQLRLMAHYLDNSPRSFSLLVGIYLLRLSTLRDENDPSSNDPRSADACIKGYAYYVGQRLVRENHKREELP